MDIVSHGLWTFVVVYILSFSGPAVHFFDTARKKFAAAAAAFALDLLFLPQFIYFATNFAGRDFPEAARQMPKWALTWYYVNHNYFFIALIALALYLLWKTYIVQITFGLALHVTMDVFTHKGFFQLKPFWPIQQAAFEGFVSWGNPAFFRWSWILLIISLTLVSMHNMYIRRKNLVQQARHIKASPDAQKQPAPSVARSQGARIGKAIEKINKQKKGHR